MVLPTEPNLNSDLPLPAMQEIQELALTFTTKNLNPAMLSEDFLKFSGIIPNEWELAKQPILTPNFAQVSFQNGVSIIAQPRTVTFVETLDLQNQREPFVPRVARQYVEKLPHAEYQTCSIGTKSIVPFPGVPDAARRYITGTLLATGPWLELGLAPVQAGLNLFYQLERCQFSLNINEAKVQMGERPALPAIIFAGSFNYNVVSESEAERLKKTLGCIDDWKPALGLFRDIVHKRFLSQAQQSLFGQLDEQSLFPN
jgi:hypothetical protein